MNTKSATPVQAQAQDVVPKGRPSSCSEADVERAVTDAFSAVFRRHGDFARPSPKQGA